MKMSIAVLQTIAALSAATLGAVPAEAETCGGKRLVEYYASKYKAHHPGACWAILRQRAHQLYGSAYKGLCNKGLWEDKEGTHPPFKYITLCAANVRLSYTFKIRPSGESSAKIRLPGNLLAPSRSPSRGARVPGLGRR